MRSYFCEEEIFPNDLSRVNKVSDSLNQTDFIWMQTCGLWQLLFEVGRNISNHLCANEKTHFIHIHVFTDALALRCTSEARLRTQLVERKGEGGEHTDQTGHTLLHILYMLWSLGMLWSKQYKLDLLVRNASQSIAAPNWWTVYFGLDVCQDKKKYFFLAKCISFPISQPSVHTAQSSTHLMPLNFLEWIPFKSVPDRTDQRRNYFCKAVSEKSSPYLLSNSGSINSGHGKAAHWDAKWDFILKMHLCNTWSMTLRCRRAGYVILSLYKQNSLSE